MHETIGKWFSYLRQSLDRYKMVEVVTPIYDSRIAAFTVGTSAMPTVKADEVVEQPAEVFEQEKAGLIERLDLWAV